MEEERGSRLRILFVSDFFFPRLGGVEQHQYQLAQCLISRGHHVVCLTGTYQGAKTVRQGVRYCTNGLKVYYVPQMSFSHQASLPFLFPLFPLFRDVVVREGIQVVHAHQTTSALAHECMLHAKTMGLKAIFTEHSLFGFANTAAIHINKFMKLSLATIDHVICVSNCSKENLVLRAHIDPDHVSVIPNAVDTSRFTPNPVRAPNPTTRINIMILSRLVYRKGVDLVVKLIPPICAAFPFVHFLIGGDGPKRLDIEEMRERHQLHKRVTLVGPVPNDQVRNFLVQGHIFLNCSLTESFCIAILEAVSCGLFVVSTRVGGVPEILPDDLLKLADPTEKDLCEALESVIPQVRMMQPVQLNQHVRDTHERIKEMYDWKSIADRTERVYHHVMKRDSLDLIDRVYRVSHCGFFVGKLFAAVLALDHAFYNFLEWWRPREEIDPAIDLDKRVLREMLNQNQL